MGYGDYTFETFLATFAIAVSQRPLFAPPPRLEPSRWLRDTLQKGRGVAFFSEKSRSEFIVAPILLTCQEMLAGTCSLYSGVLLDIDADRGLKGECDFILARTPPAPALRAPLLVVVEAKKNDIEVGLAQCAAQMVAARLFNEQHQEAVPAVYGCVHDRRGVAIPAAPGGRARRRRRPLLHHGGRRHPGHPGHRNEWSDVAPGLMPGRRRRGTGGPLRGGSSRTARARRGPGRSA